MGGLVLGIFSRMGVISVGRMGWLKGTEYLSTLRLRHIPGSELQPQTMLFMLRYGLLLVAAFAVPSAAQVSIPRKPVGDAPPLPPGEPQVSPSPQFAFIHRLQWEDTKIIPAAAIAHER